MCYDNLITYFSLYFMMDGSGNFVWNCAISRLKIFGTYIRNRYINPSRELKCTQSVSPDVHKNSNKQLSDYLGNHTFPTACGEMWKGTSNRCKKWRGTHLILY